jgi:hypothetical protein
MKLRLRRGGTPALVLCLYLALGSILLGAVAVAAAANGAAEREYRRSQALALAEAGVAEAMVGEAPYGGQTLGTGQYSWSSIPTATGRLVTARGQTVSASGVTVTRTVRAVIAGSGAGAKIRAWEEGP